MPCLNYHELWTICQTWSKLKQQRTSKIHMDRKERKMLLLISHVTNKTRDYSWQHHLIVSFQNLNGYTSKSKTKKTKLNDCFTQAIFRQCIGR